MNRQPYQCESCDGFCEDECAIAEGYFEGHEFEYITNKCEDAPCNCDKCLARVEDEVSLNAAKFASITHKASEIAKIISQPFEVRFKGNNEAAAILASDYDSLLHLAGKTVKVSVDWSCLRDYLWLMDGCKIVALIYKDDFKKVFTQKGKIKAICEFWKDAAGHNQLNK